MMKFIRYKTALRYAKIVQIGSGVLKMWAVKRIGPVFDATL